MTSIKDQTKEALFTKWLQSGSPEDLNQFFEVTFSELQQIAKSRGKCKGSEWEDIFQEASLTLSKRLEMYRSKNKIHTLGEFHSLYNIIFVSKLNDVISMKNSNPLNSNENDNPCATKSVNIFPEISKEQVRMYPDIFISMSLRKKILNRLRDIDFHSENETPCNQGLNLLPLTEARLDCEQKNKYLSHEEFMETINKIIIKGDDMGVIDRLEKKVNIGIRSQASRFWKSPDWIEILIWYLENNRRQQIWMTMRDQLMVHHEEAVAFIKDACRKFIDKHRQNLPTDADVILSELMENGEIGWNDHQSFENVLWTAFRLVRIKAVLRSENDATGKARNIARIHAALGKHRPDLDSLPPNDLLLLSKCFEELEKKSPKQYRYIAAYYFVTPNYEKIAQIFKVTGKTVKNNIEEGLSFLQDLVTKKPQENISKKL